MDIQDSSRIVFDSTGFTPKNAFGIAPGVPTISAFMIAPALIAGGIFLYIDLSSGYLDWSKDVVPFIKWQFLPALVIIPLTYRIFFYRRAYKKFSIAEDGICAEKRFVAWRRIRDFHMLGDSPSERIGGASVSPLQIDPTNVYSGSGVYVLTLHRAFHSTIRLRVSPDLADTFEKTLAEQGILRRSKLKLWIFG